MTDDPTWPDGLGGATLAEFATLRSVTRVSIASDIDDLWRQSAWEMYEVAPDWQRFCEFGPRDIGSVWEDLGVIRRKSRQFSPSQIAAAQRSMTERLERHIMHEQCKYGSAW